MVCRVAASPYPVYVVYSLSLWERVRVRATNYFIRAI